jgi:TRAP-type mannitol/chloroaromatic compound transport system permease large subunit
VELIQPQLAGLMGVVLLMVFLALGVPIGFGAAVVGFLGILSLVGMGPALMTTATAPFSKIVNYTYSAIPLFVVMGYFAYGSGLGREAFEVGKRWLGGIAGGLDRKSVV